MTAAVRRRLPHAVFAVGALTHTSHGLGTGLLLPYVMEFNRPARGAELAELSNLMGGDAGDTLLPSGNGELAIVGARKWQGVGPYLLDALVEMAAAAGVPNLEADVLTANRPMLALLRSRGTG